MATIVAVSETALGFGWAAWRLAGTWLIKPACRQLLPRAVVNNSFSGIVGHAP
jgi:hypothetical protein